MKYPLFVSESVCAGHPDKVCDQISDSILDEALKIDPKSRVAIETLVTANRVVLAGEITCPKIINFEEIVKNVIESLSFNQPIYNFDKNSLISTYVHQQSPDIAIGADNGGAGDQGMMFGYAVNETPQMMPLPIVLAHELTKRMDELQENELKYLRPDGKSEVTVCYENGKPVGIDKIVLAKPFDLKIDTQKVKSDLYKFAILPILEKYKLAIISEDKIILNGTGRWEIGGPATDTGVTGRKIVVDTYGGTARIGGGCFSGKDPTKVDRSGAYAARYIAKNIVAHGLADRCEVQIAYAIGYKDPIAKSIDTFGTAKKDKKVIEDFAWNLLDLSVGGIIDGLNLRQPIYRDTAKYGHFGYEQYPWEKILNK